MQVLCVALDTELSNVVGDACSTDLADPRKHPVSSVTSSMLIHGDRPISL